MRRSIALLVSLLISFTALMAQSSIRDALQRSRTALVYRISADTAEAYILKGMQAPDAYLARSPFATWNTDSLKYEDLPVGNYFILAVRGNQITTEYYCQSNLRVFPVNDQYRVQFEVRDSMGNAISDARLWMDRKEISFNNATASFQARQKKPDGAIIRVAIPGDTLFLEIDAADYEVKTGWSQWWTNFRYTRTGNILSWPVTRVKHFLNDERYHYYNRYSARKRRNSYRMGYMVFNKPKYQPGDTLKYKAYVLNRHGKAYRHAMTAHLRYSSHGSVVDRELGKLKPEPKGSFVHQFVLGDSLESDMSYTLMLTDKKKKNVFRGTFKIEDYLLDEVGSYDLRSRKQEYFRHDTLVFYAGAKDANGLPLMDGRIRLSLLAERVDSFYKEREFVRDTLWSQEKPLSVEGETKFEVPGPLLPQVDLPINAVAEYRNSNNEVHTKDVSIQFRQGEKLIRVRKEGSFIIAEYMEKGMPVAKKGAMRLADNKEHAINFPYRAKLDPYAESYEFIARSDSGSIIAYKIYETDQSYEIPFSRLQVKDSSGFYLHNPEQITVHYSVTYGQRILIKGSDTAEWISWKGILDRNKQYRVDWNYFWQGKEKKGSAQLVLLDKVLNGTITQANTVYPGQRDTITVSVDDYRGKPVAGMNLTAVSYNSQFKSDIHVPEPPLMQRFRLRRGIRYSDYELFEAGIKKTFLLGEHQQWRARLGLDSMAYYKLLFPEGAFERVSSPIMDLTPQVAVHVVRKGVPQEIYILFINKEFAWYNGATDQGRYSFAVAPGYTQISFRLRDRYVRLDSIYLQPFYKHDISIDLDHLPASASVEERDTVYANWERQMIESNIFQLKNDYRTTNGYVWQGNRLIHLSQQGDRLMGPFIRDSIQYFKPGNFDIRFPFEPGYQYSVWPQMTRLELNSIFPRNQKARLPRVNNTVWILGDTLEDLPTIQYEKKKIDIPLLTANERDDWKLSTVNSSRLEISLPNDSLFLYAILYNSSGQVSTARIHRSGTNRFTAIAAGRYDLVLITSAFHFLKAHDLDIPANGIFYLKFMHPVYESSDPFITSLQDFQAKAAIKANEDLYPAERALKFPLVKKEEAAAPAGNAGITGLIIDAKGKEPIVGAMVTLKGYATGLPSGTDGRYLLSKLASGRFILVVSAVGYTTKEIAIDVLDGIVVTADVRLSMSEQALSEVVVIAYGIARKRSLTGSISTVNGMELSQALQGAVAGVSINDQDQTRIVIRGVTSLNSKPLYVIDGVLMDELPEGFDLGQAQVSVLKENVAVSLYGSRAAAGVIVVMTKGAAPPVTRDKFRDYAFWQPNLVTDKNGKAGFSVVYPDNITGWEMYVIGMDKKKRILKTTGFTKSFKPVLAQLSVPRFLVQGDSADLIGKLVNYTTDAMELETTFSIDKTPVSSNQQLPANSSVTKELRITASAIDTISAEYSIRNNSGYGDGELRKIPVFEKGDEEANGLFISLTGDTSFTFAPKAEGKLVLHAESNTLGILLDEIDYLKAYPFECMEQAASKLTGLLMEKRIRRSLGQVFTGEKEVQRLLSRLQHGQQFDGGWSWWPGGRTDILVTNYVLRALLLLRNDIPVESNIRDGLLYLQNRIATENKFDRLNSLFTMSRAAHEMNYTQYIDKLAFDSLTTYQQCQVISIRQSLNMPVTNEINKAFAEAAPSMTGSLHWGNKSYRWESNEMATTVLAFEVFKKQKGNEEVLRRIIQYFLETRQRGKWMNTVESASVVSTILPFVLEQNKSFTEPPHLAIAGDTTMTVDAFPFTHVMNMEKQPVTISKSGGGIVYFTAWQRVMNKEPLPVTDNFVIDTWFEHNGQRITSLTAGEKATMKIRVRVLKDASYVRISVPIPGGCTYAEKKQESSSEHREFRKNRMDMFVEQMNTGVHEFTIELEPRYTGSYQVNPARAELMYFPVLFGRDGGKRVSIGK